MPDVITLSDVADITAMYLEDPDTAKWQDIVRKYTHNTFALFVEKRIQTGNAHERQTFNVKVRKANNTVPSTLYDEDSTNIVNHMAKGTVFTHMQKTHWALDKRDPAFMSKSATQIVDYIKVRESDAHEGFYEQNEEWFWTLPPGPNDGSNGKPLPLGVPYWLPKNTTTAAWGFNGPDPNGYAAGAANLLVATYPGWSHGTGMYTDMTDQDFGLLMTKALDNCYFRPPRANEGEQAPLPSVILRSSDEPYYNYQSWLMQANDNTEKDAGKYRGGRLTNNLGEQVYRMVPWERVPAISLAGDAARDTREPVYGFNMDTWEIRDYGGMFMNLSEQVSSKSHNLLVNWFDTGYQICCKNRRSNFVLCKSTASAA